VWRCTGTRDAREHEKRKAAGKFSIDVTSVAGGPPTLSSQDEVIGELKHAVHSRAHAEYPPADPKKANGAAGIVNLDVEFKAAPSVARTRGTVFERDFRSSAFCIG
ncbi:MAG TPA: hypothetical protein VGC79_13095, partial [Polyangiaceae bacterium]